MTAWQYDAAMVDFGRRHTGKLRFEQGGVLSQCSAAGRAPVGFLVESQDSMAMGADSLHGAILFDLGWVRDTGKPCEGRDQAACLI